MVLEGEGCDEGDEACVPLGVFAAGAVAFVLGRLPGERAVAAGGVEVSAAAFADDSDTGTASGGEDEDWLGVPLWSAAEFGVHGDEGGGWSWQGVDGEFDGFGVGVAIAEDCGEAWGGAELVIDAGSEFRIFS